MAEFKVKWLEGDGNIIAKSPSRGDGPLTFTTDGPNEGLDREQVVTVETVGGSNTETVQVVVKQRGKRQRVVLADGDLLATANNEKFNVLK